MRLKNDRPRQGEGYLTYAEINDHLPDDMLDAEQIETIISMINDMGVQVYDEAPDAETLLMAEVPLRLPTRRRRRKRRRRSRRWIPSSAARPTRYIYMREMGSVELLTREGEIEIAKRIEDGLRHMIQGDLRLPDHDRRNPLARRENREGRNPRR